MRYGKPILSFAFGIPFLGIILNILSLIASVVISAPFQILLGGGIMGVIDFILMGIQSVAMLIPFVGGFILPLIQFLMVGIKLNKIIVVGEPLKRFSKKRSLINLFKVRSCWFCPLIIKSVSVSESQWL